MFPLPEPTDRAIAALRDLRQRSAVSLEACITAGYPGGLLAGSRRRGGLLVPRYAVDAGGFVYADGPNLDTRRIA